MPQIGIAKFLTSAIIMLGLIAGTFSLIYIGLPSTISDSRFTEYNKTLNKFNDVYDNVDTIKTSIEDSTPKSGVLGLINGLIESSWGALKLIWNSVNVIKDVIMDLLTIIPLPIPSWFIYMIIGAILIIVTFSLITLFFGRET